MEALEHQSFCITLIQQGVHRIDEVLVFQYEQGGSVAVFTVVTEAPFLVERGLPRHRARLPNSFKEGSTPEDTMQWRILAARRMADYLRNNQALSQEAIDLSDLESFDGHRPSSVFW